MSKQAKMTGKKKKLVLFDAYAIIFRAYHALPDFVSSKGQPTGALYGLSTMLMRIITEMKPDYMAACYDLAETTFRKQVYEGYKATRKETDAALIAQIDLSKEIFKSFGIPIYAVAGFEADDIIGTIAEQTSGEKDLQVVIASGDMDTMQLVDDDRVVVYTLKKGLNDMITYDETAVVERFGFKPELLPDYKGLRGDPSDNIIGIKGVGDKTASILIQQFGSLENLYKQVKKDPEAIIKAGLTPRISKLIEEGEEEALFSKTLAVIRRDAPINFVLPENGWQTTLDVGVIEKLFNELEFRTLTSRLKTLLGKQGIASGVEVETESEEKKSDTPLDAKLVREVQIGLWLLNSEVINPTIDDVYTHTKTKDLAEAHKIILKELTERDLLKVYEEIELPLIPIIIKAAARGVLIDKNYFADLSKRFHKDLLALEKEIYKQAGQEFNINSPKQLGDIVFDKLALTAKGLKKTAGGARSTRESELEKLRDSHPIIKSILEYRELAKLLSTYVDPIPTMADETNRLHSSLNQTGASTGRMSSSNPNLQNIPNREGVGQTIRNGFIASPRHVFLACDYSQIEMRVLAVLSGDKDLIDIFTTGKDIHTSVAARVFNVSEADVTKDMRRKAKVINFGIIYGMGVNALKQNLGSTRDEAEEFYNNYFATFPTIKNYFDTVKADAMKEGYTATAFGRRRYFPGLKSRLPYVKAMAERMAMNAPIQGTAADIVKIAMRQVTEALEKAKLSERAHLLLQIHDELIFEVEDGVVPEAQKVIIRAMEEIEGINVPLAVNAASGKRWGELRAL